MLTAVTFCLHGRGHPSSRSPIFCVCWQSQATATILGAGKLPQTRNIGGDEDLELQGERGPVKSRKQIPTTLSGDLPSLNDADLHACDCVKPNTH